MYATDDRPGIARRGKPGAFYYVDAHGRRIRNAPTLNRIRGLVIPPAWIDVWINPRARGHLQASGRDARGRKQYLYHAEWRATRDAAKFGNLVAFARVLPRVRRATRVSLRRKSLDRDRVAAVIVRLLEASLIRIGNEEYARANQSYGLTTLRTRHARINGSRIRFTFRGKSAQPHRIEVGNPNLARVVRHLQDLPGQELFCYLDQDHRCRRLRSDDVNAYLRTHAGGNFTAKDFRTWAGTMLAALALAQFPKPNSQTEAKRSHAAAIRLVAERLGNTPAIARRSYIHPVIFEAFNAGKLPQLPPPEAWPPADPGAALTSEERAVLRVLRTHHVRRA